MSRPSFRGGPVACVGMEQAAACAARVLAQRREAQQPVFFLQHLSLHSGAAFFVPGTPGAQIHASVAPQSGEPVIRKHFPNSFRETDLHQRLQELGVEELVICGAMTHMCVDATTRAAFDLGYRCTVLHDACTTRDLTFNGRSVAAADVQAAFMAALASPYARVLPTADYLASNP